MTVIEFFDRESAIENVVSALLCSPEKVVFIGNSIKKMIRSVENYKRITESRNISAEFSFKGVSKNNLGAIVEAIEKVVSENDDCVVDLSGGDDLYLVAVGMVYQKYPDRIKLHRFNISNNTMLDCDSDGKLCADAPMEINVDENIAIYGGRIVYDSEKSNGTYRWDFDDEFVCDVRAVWSVCRKNPTLWNAQINTLEKLAGRYLNRDSLSFYAKNDSAKKLLIEKGDRFTFEKDIFKSLEAAGIIKNFKADEEQFGFEFKNAQVMKCLTKAGLILELIIAVTAFGIRDDSGDAVYNDVMTGVCIDWDGIIQPDYKTDVENEIDVILIKGMVPVFISCKNGIISVDELYKLSVVSEKFGGKFVKKVLVASELEKMGSRGEYIKARAEDMKIKVIDDVDKKSENELNRIIASLWKG